MFSEAANILQDYGWAALLLFIFGTILFKYVSSLLKIWSERDKYRNFNKKALIKQNLARHQFFSNADFLIANEIPTLTFNGLEESPVKIKIFRELLKIKVQCMKEAALVIVNADLEDLTPNQWANYAKECMANSEECVKETSTKLGIPTVIVQKFMVWKHNNSTVLDSYISDLAISDAYTTNTARTNTLLYLLHLKLVTFVSDAEREAFEINGEFQGLHYDGYEIE